MSNNSTARKGYPVRPDSTRTPEAKAASRARRALAVYRAQSSAPLNVAAIMADLAGVTK